MTHQELNEIFKAVEKEMAEEKIGERLLAEIKPSLESSTASPIAIATSMLGQAIIGYNNVFLFRILSRALCKD